MLMFQLPLTVKKPLLPLSKDLLFQFTISTYHNAPCPPPPLKKKKKAKKEAKPLSLLQILFFLREGGLSKVHYGLCENGKIG